MRETMCSKIERLLDDTNVYRAELVLKCKTKDGMIYTVEVIEIDRSNVVEGVPFGSFFNARACEAVIDLTESVGLDGGYTLSLHELVSIQNSEIARVWVEIGDLYTQENHLYPCAE